jgi:hypothetical protein
VPVRLKVGGQIILSSWGTDAMTHPDYRRLGLFNNISKELFANAARIGINTSSGIPNRYSHPGLVKKFGWFDVSPMNEKVKALNWKNTVMLKTNNRLLAGLLTILISPVFEKILLRTRKMPTADRITITRITSFDERFDKLWSMVSGQYQIMVVRNSEYLNWRFRTPDKQYLIFAAEKDDEIQGYLVLRIKTVKNAKAGVIFDMVTQSEDIMQYLVAEAVNVSYQAGADLIIYSSIADRSYYRVLREKGFISLPFSKGIYFSVYSGTSRISKAFLQDPKNWFVQTGDSDIL